MLSIYFDEDAGQVALVRVLRERGFSCLTTSEAGRSSEPDDRQLQFAHSRGMAVMTANVGDYARLHWRWMAEGQEHAGIILLTDQLTPVGRQLRALTALSDQVTNEAMRNRLEYLLNWA